MEKCNQCNSKNIKLSTHLKYHDIFNCNDCNYWTYKSIEDCCRKPYIIIAQDHKFQTQTRLYRQCINCGGCLNRTKPLNFKEFGNDCEAEFDNFSFENWRTLKFEEKKMLASNKKDYNNSSHERYQIYLASEEWKDKRQKVLNRDKNLCQNCMIKPAEDVHHLTYNNLFNEPLGDLISLCRKCHSEAHNVIKVPE